MMGSVLLQPKFVVGLMLATQPADNIMEQSTVTRNLCVESLEQRQLERNVAISLRSMLSGYANPGKLLAWSTCNVR